MPDLYRLHVGPVNAAYYQRQFQRFESAGKAMPSWNHGAAFFTLAWLVLRKLWRPAGIYAAGLVVALALWWWGIHGRVPLAVESAVCALATLLLCVLPGFIGNGLYYHHVRKLTLQTLTSATSLGQARVQLAEHAVTKERLQLVASVQALVALGIAFALFFQAGAPRTPSTDNAAAAASGPPNLVIPAVPSVAPPELQPFTPDVALPMPESPVPIAPEPASAAPAVTAPLPNAAPAPAEAAPAAAAPASSWVPDAKELSIVALAQSIPAQGAASAALAPAAVEAKPVLTAAQPAKQATTTPAFAPAAKTAVPSKPATPAVTKPKQPPVPAKPVAVATNGKAAGKYYLNAGVYAQASNVEAAVKKLNAAKLNAIRQTVSSKNGELTRLRIGPFETRKQAEQAAAQARKLRIDTSVIEPPQAVKR